jgi:uncharacterized C2H2 Zn-finger protein
MEIITIEFLKWLFKLAAFSWFVSLLFKLSASYLRHLNGKDLEKIRQKHEIEIINKRHYELEMKMKDELKKLEIKSSRDLNIPEKEKEKLDLKMNYELEIKNLTTIQYV